MRMGRAGGLLVDGTAEEHLRIGALEDAGDAGEQRKYQGERGHEQFTQHTQTENNTRGHEHTHTGPRSYGG